jgi:hypothetical protein
MNESLEDMEHSKSDMNDSIEVAIEKKKKLNEIIFGKANLSKQSSV